MNWSRHRLKKLVRNGINTDNSGKVPVVGPHFGKCPIGSPTYPKALLMLISRLIAWHWSRIAKGSALLERGESSPYGLSCAEAVRHLAAQRGICIISGGARGCDARAHQAAKRSHRSLSWGWRHPPSHVPLFQEIINNGGAIVSSRMSSLRTVYLSCSQSSCRWLISGAYRLAFRWAHFQQPMKRLKQIVRYSAVPGAITSPTSAGANGLIYQGCKHTIVDDLIRYALSSLFVSWKPKSVLWMMIQSRLSYRWMR